MFERKYLLFSLLCGFLLSISWPLDGFSPLLFVAFVPLLFIENKIANSGFSRTSLPVFLYAYLAFFIWNIFTTFWVYYSSAFGAAMAFIFNSLFMALVFLLFHNTKKRLGNTTGYTALACYWMAFEYLHLDWDLSWPWLVLGNGFSEYYKFIQWYEYTGVFGGSLWVLAVNIMIFRLINKIKTDTKLVKSTIVPASILGLSILIPVITSLYVYHSYNEKLNPVEIAVVQPNIDPYNEKFDGMSQEAQLNKLLNLAATQVDSETDYFIGPETALSEGIWESDLEYANSTLAIRKFISPYPNLKFIGGLSSYRMYETYETPSSTARRFRKQAESFDAYNSAMQIDNQKPVQIYHKSKLVPGVEKLPFPSLLGPLEKLAINLGGMTGSLGVQSERTPLVSHSDSLKVAPVICYESIYGEFLTKYVLNGANLIFIITNDGWWQDTPGYRQHNSYARLRAIENRRSIARSANTGISCFINQKGDMSQATEWWVPACIKQKLNANSQITFYTKYGDIIARISLFLSALLIIYTISVSLNKNRLRNIKPD